MTNDSNEEIIEKEAGTKLESTSETVSIAGAQKSHQETQLDGLWSMLRENNSFLKEIKSIIQERLEYDVAKEKVVDKLNDELRFYRDNFVFQSQKSMFIDLMLLYDHLERILAVLGTDDVFSKEKTTELLQTFKEELLEILYRKDITPFEEHPEYLNHKLHKTIKTIPTNEESENNKVDEIIKTGFRWNDNILRPEEVIIKKYIKE